MLPFEMLFHSRHHNFITLGWWRTINTDHHQVNLKLWREWFNYWFHRNFHSRHTNGVDNHLNSFVQLFVAAQNWLHEKFSARFPGLISARPKDKILLKQQAITWPKFEPVLKTLHLISPLIRSLLSRSSFSLTTCSSRTRSSSNWGIMVLNLFI